MDVHPSPLFYHTFILISLLHHAHTHTHTQALFLFLSCSPRSLQSFLFFFFFLVPEPPWDLMRSDERREVGSQVAPQATALLYVEQPSPPSPFFTSYANRSSFLRPVPPSRLRYASSSEFAIVTELCRILNNNISCQNCKIVY